MVRKTYHANLLFMSLPNKATANADSLAAITALQSAANAQFILLATDLINDAISRGVYAVSLNTVDPIDLSSLAAYFATLGYSVTFPDYVNFQDQPAQLFGQAWNEFWLINRVPPYIKNPARMIISWL